MPPVNRRGDRRKVPRGARSRLEPLLPFSSLSADWQGADSGGGRYEVQIQFTSEPVLMSNDPENAQLLNAINTTCLFEAWNTGSATIGSCVYAGLEPHVPGGAWGLTMVVTFPGMADPAEFCRWAWPINSRWIVSRSTGCGIGGMQLTSGAINGSVIIQTP